MKKLVCLMLLTTGGLACEPLENAFVNNTPVDPACQGTTATVAGTWQIIGEGERSDCDDQTFDTTLFSLSSEPLEIVQTDTFFELSSIDPPLSFTLFDGDIDGRCFEFRTSETTELGNIDYDWTGRVSTDGATLNGQFTGSGPSGCEVRGTFRINYMPAP